MRQEGQDRSGLPEREDPLGALGVTGEDPLAVLRAEDQENVGLIEDPPGELSGAVLVGIGSESLRDPGEGVIEPVPDHGHDARRDDVQALRHRVGPEAGRCECGPADIARADEEDARRSR